MNRPIGAHGQAGPQYPRSFVAAQRDDHGLAAVLLLQSKRFFQRIIVRFAGNERQFLVLNPRFGFINREPGRGIRYGLNAANDFHATLPHEMKKNRFYNSPSQIGPEQGLFRYSSPVL